ncbi:MAG: aspartate/glutamate racemase family protein [Alphaproteobacteria bacterium]
MKTIGLIGGMSWESTIEYYRLINIGIKERLGGLHSAKVVLWSFNFDEIVKLQNTGNWEEATAKMLEAGKALRLAGADVLLICTNTMHLMAEQVEEFSALPLIHIADVTAAQVKHQGYKKIALLATRFTMEQDFYRERFTDRYQLEVMIPEAEERLSIHQVIYQELCKGIVREETRLLFKEIIHKMRLRGAEAVVLGCTEIGLLISQKDVEIPLFDTTILHAEAAVDFALAE